jgi:hypothetical protein
MRKYPLPRTAEDPRFTIGLLVEVSNLLERRGYPKIDEGLDLVALQQALLDFLYARALPCLESERMTEDFRFAREAL